MIEGLLRNLGDLDSEIEHLRLRRRDGCFHAVIFTTATSPHAAVVFCSVVAFAAAASIPSIRFAGVRPWPDAGEPLAGAGAGGVT